MSFEEWWEDQYKEYEEMDGLTGTAVHSFKTHAHRAWMAGFDWCIKLMNYYREYPSKSTKWVRDFIDEEEKDAIRRKKEDR